MSEQGAVSNNRGRRLVTVAAAAILAITCALVVAGTSRAVSINYPDFGSTDGLQLNGDAQVAGDDLRLTDAVASQGGSAFTKRRIVNPRRAFRTKFKVEQHDGSGNPADGLAFVIQGEGRDALGAVGGGLGYGSLAPSVAVELDLYYNSEGDPFGDHVGITAGGDAYTHLDQSEFELADQKTWVWVYYSAKSHVLKVWCAHKSKRPKKPRLRAEINLKKEFGGDRAFAGFTASTGEDYAIQDILSWSFTQKR